SEIRRTRPGYPYRGVADIGLDECRPRIGRCGDGCEVGAPEAMPTLPEDIAKGTCRSAVDHEGDVMKRIVADACYVDPLRIVDDVIRGVPALVGEVDAATERNGVVHHDDLLVMAGLRRRFVVHDELDLLGHRPAPDEHRQRFAILGEQKRVIPQEDANTKLRALGDCMTQQRLQRLRRARVRVSVAGAQPDTAVDIPTGNQNLVPGGEDGSADGSKIAVAIHEHCRPARPGDGRTRLALDKYRIRGGHTQISTIRESTVNAGTRRFCATPSDGQTSETELTTGGSGYLGWHHRSVPASQP